MPLLVPTLTRSLDQLVGDLAAGSDASALVLLTAPPGAGLSTVARALADRCGPDAVVRAAAVHRLLGLPWEAGEEGALLTGLVEPVPGRPGATADRWLQHLERSPVASGSSGAGPVWDAVVLVEDAQHADAFTVQTLVSAARRSCAAHVLVVLAWSDSRTGAIPLDGAAGLLAAVRAAAHRIVTLPSLGRSDLQVLADRRGVILPAARADEAIAFTGGNTRQLVELLATVRAADWGSPHLTPPVPATVARRTASRLAAVGPPGRALALAAAVLESADPRARGVDVATAARVAGGHGTTPGVDPAVLGELLATGLLLPLDERATRVRFPDPATRAAVLTAADLTERLAAHAVAAPLEPDPAVALRHTWLATAGPDESLAVRLDEEAGRHAHDGAWATVADLLIMAARASADHDAAGARLLRAVDALVGAGDVTRATAYLPEIEALRETPLRNAVLGYLAVVRGRPVEAEDRLTRAWALVNPDREPETASLIAQRRVLHALARCRAGDLVDWADEAMAVEDPSAPAAMEAAAIRGLGVAVVRGMDVALADHRALGERVPAGPVAQRVGMAAGWLHGAAGDMDRAREELESAVPTDQSGGSLRISLWSRGWLARVQFRTGDWDAALHTATVGVDAAERSGITLLLPLLAWTRVQVLALRGDLEGARRALRAVEAGARSYEIMRVPAGLAGAALAEETADHAGVLRALAPLTQPWAREWISHPGFWPWAQSYATALALAGRLDEADAFLRSHERRADATGIPAARAGLAAARGRWHGTRGETEPSRAAFTRALELLEPLSLPHETATTQLAFGQILRRAGRRAEADPLIGAARETWLHLGATNAVARCDRERAAAGVTGVRERRDVGELTPQEEAVVALVARGHTNREAAAELFLSVKTVQYHLTRVYTKLGIRSRAELAALRGNPG